MIYLFHKIDTEIKSRSYVSPEYFEKFLIEHPNDEIHFDGVYYNAFKYGLPILKKHKRKATWFITGRYVGENNEFDKTEPLEIFCDWNEIITLDRFQEIGWHTWDHTQEIIEIEPPIEMEKFAYPHGKFTQEHIKEAKKYFKYAYALENGNDNLYSLKRLTVKECEY